MQDKITLALDLGMALRRHRQDRHMSVTDLAQRARRTRDVIYRLENGEDTTVASLLAVASALGLALRLDKAGMPTLGDVQARFGSDDDDADEDRPLAHRMP